MRIVLYFTDNLTDPRVITFDLNFAQSNYSKIHKIEFPNASPELVRLLGKDPSVSHKSGKRPITSSSNSSSNNKKPKTKPKSNANHESTSSRSSSSSRSSISSHSSQQSSSKQTAKKKPESSSAHTKTAKKAKPESIKAESSKSKPEKYPKRSSYSPPPPPPSSSSSSLPQQTQPPIPRSPSFNNLSPAPNSIPISSPANSHMTTNTPDSNDEKIISPTKDMAVDDENAEHAYTLRDVYNLDSIHRTDIDEETRERWGIPEVITIFTTNSNQLKLKPFR